MVYICRNCVFTFFTWFGRNTVCHKDAVLDSEPVSGKITEIYGTDISFRLWNQWHGLGCSNHGFELMLFKYFDQLLLKFQTTMCILWRRTSTDNSLLTFVIVNVFVYSDSKPISTCPPRAHESRYFLFGILHSGLTTISISIIYVLNTVLKWFVVMLVDFE